MSDLEDFPIYDRLRLDRPGFCRICRLEYAPHSPRDRAFHRRQHIISLRPYQPKPDPEFADNVDVIVDKASPKKLHKLVFERTQALRREGCSGQTQWGEDCAPPGPIHAILLIEDATPVGAVSFRWMRWTDAPDEWRILMAWIAEPWRRKGVLSRRWDRWRETYDEFSIERPISRGMASFLAKRGYAVSIEDLVGEPEWWL
jgi:hypothetical protein